jgi:hypothetical protein
MKSKNCIENRNLLFPYTIAEEIDNSNCLERNSEVKENKILNIIERITKGRIRDLIKNAIKENTIQYQKNLRQQKLLDGVIKL